MSFVRSGIRRIRDHLHGQSVHRHRSNLPLRQAQVYTRYHEFAREEAPVDLNVLPERAREPAKKFRDQAVVTFPMPESEELATSILTKLRAREAGGADIWDLESSLYRGENGYSEYPEFEQMFHGLLGDVLRGAFGCEFKLHHFRIRKSVRLRDFARGSELWHSDTGPGTCINIVVGLTELSESNGATEVLPWAPTEDLLLSGRPIVRKRIEDAQKRRQVGREELREIKCRYYDERVESDYADQVVRAEGPPGSVLLWNTNSMHRGGFPNIGKERVVMLCHAYPSHRPTHWDRYRTEGCSKSAWPNISGRGTQPFPSDPAEDF